MGICKTCGGAVFPSGEVTGYGGPLCAFGGNHMQGSGLVPPDSDTKPDTSNKPPEAQKGTL